MGNYIQCNNGHTYEDNNSGCPYCPKKGNAYNEETVLDSNTGKAGDFDKTVIETKDVKGNNGNNREPSSAIKSPDFDKTMVINANESESSKESINRRKLVGWLVTYTLDSMGNDYKLFEGKNNIGSGANSDIQLNDSTISGKHCLILYRGNKFVIKDELSTNGTFVNDQDIDERMNLVDGDKIKIGSIELIFRTTMP